MALLIALLACITLTSYKVEAQSHSSSPRTLAQYYRPRTCDIFPRMCLTEGSLGPDCCWKRCVDLKNDSFNCGRCGKVCSYTEVCCDGQCVNVLFDKSNCGGCGSTCAEGSYCRYGMCSYAR
ncbi:hypothetical protein QJS10_CPB04g01740 [Acorus calamus]|uniref:4Fe-4S ferredoxin-type domain-containing protein n=1 Tax=Acorus calamus TaxID=4465 RepID=A0AAV9F134_ACOCL|nr:hypothetical protein QJS10_CPB04g01740 [Acorus calamus]